MDFVWFSYGYCLGGLSFLVKMKSLNQMGDLDTQIIQHWGSERYETLVCLTAYQGWSMFLVGENVSLTVK